MKDISKLKNYRAKFKRHYGIEFSREYVVHHIDFDRSNNDISNLLLLPRKLHSRYHFCMSSMRTIGSGDGPSFYVDGRIRSGIQEHWYLSILDTFADTMAECAKWMDYKLYLDGQMPNIHGIVLD